MITNFARWKIKYNVISEALKTICQNVMIFNNNYFKLKENYRRMTCIYLNQDVYKILLNLKSLWWINLIKKSKYYWFAYGKTLSLFSKF